MAESEDAGVRLTIERMAYGADAVAHDGGKVIFVRNGAPGDVVDVTIVNEEATLSHACVKRIIKPGPERVTPSCSLAGLCGGCPWAHLSRSAQLAAKRTSIVDALARIGGIATQRAEQLVEDCVGIEPTIGYRNKVELGFARIGGRAVVGMHAAGGRDIIKTDRCALLNAADEKLTKAVSGAVTYLANAHDLQLLRVGIRSSSRTKSLEIALWTAPGPFPRSQAAKVIGDATKGRATSIVRVLAKGPAKARRVTGVERLAGKGFWEERVGKEAMLLSAPSFFQVNTAGAQKLVELVLDGLAPTTHDEAMDLYSGAGTFTLPLARRCAFVSAVESYGPAVRDLRRNLELSGIDNVDAVGGDARREFPNTDADVIVVDPPRVGLSKGVIERLSAQPARAIAYVSCDPATLARDLARFVELGVFAPERITPVDLFPQTYHVETVTLLAHC